MTQTNSKTKRSKARKSFSPLLKNDKIPAWRGLDVPVLALLLARDVPKSLSHTAPQGFPFPGSSKWELSREGGGSELWKTLFHPPYPRQHREKTIPSSSSLLQPIPQLFDMTGKAWRHIRPIKHPPISGLEVNSFGATLLCQPRELFRVERSPTVQTAGGRTRLLEVINIQFATRARSLTLQMSCANTAFVVGERPKAPSGHRALLLPRPWEITEPLVPLCSQPQPQEWCK